MGTFGIVLMAVLAFSCSTVWSGQSQEDAGVILLGYKDVCSKDSMCGQGLVCLSGVCDCPEGRCGAFLGYICETESFGQSRVPVKLYCGDHASCNLSPTNNNSPDRICQCRPGFVPSHDQFNCIANPKSTGGVTVPVAISYGINKSTVGHMAFTPGQFSYDQTSRGLTDATSTSSSSEMPPSPTSPIMPQTQPNDSVWSVPTFPTTKASDSDTDAVTITVTETSVNGSDVPVWDADKDIESDNGNSDNVTTTSASSKLQQLPVHKHAILIAITVVIFAVFL